MVKRGRAAVKRYGVIFTCLSSRAVHLEVASSLDTDSAVNAIRRFVARRGMVKFIRSDNGTNLVGAEKELRQELAKLKQSSIRDTLCDKGIKWEFNPPTGSHFGGVWERLIRSVRKIMYGLLYELKHRLDDEGLHTLLCEVEAVLNSRPITASSTQSDDLRALTPNDLLLAHNTGAPPGEFSKDDCYARKRWRRVQYLVDLFWKRWVSEYLPLLQERQKWLKPRRNVSIGDIVLLIDNAPRGSWALGRVVSTKEDSKGLVRMVKVKTATSLMERPVQKLCLILEADCDG
ncbi:uncharacterized protein [Asterias amurensis]|uniref:uncharacterized protein n=1 Tax=Asterias amurensis TaxID=7602 RepID=UPI003AB293C4